MALPALLFAGCADDSLVAEPEDVDAPAEVTLNLTIPAEQVVQIGTRADAPISSVTVFCYNQNGSHLSHTTYTSGWQGSGSDYSLKVPLHRQTRSIEIVTNATVAPGDHHPSDLYTSDPNAGVLWGKASLVDILDPASKIPMIRQWAKVSVDNQAGSNTFKVLGLGVSGAASQGSLAPASANFSLSGTSLNITTPTIKSGEKYEYKSGIINGADAEVRLFETKRDDTVAADQFNTRARIIIYGEYNGKKGYYVCAFRTRTGSGLSEDVAAGSETGAVKYTPIDVLRNHHYTVTVDRVRAEGWPTLEEAEKAEPDNRITVLITDRNDEIVDITANRDYMLGVSGDVTADYDKSANFTVVTSGPDPKFTASASWIKTNQASLGTAVTVTGVTQSVNSTAKKYNVSIPLDANNKTTISRTATITVRCGELTRTINVTQLGYDFKNDSRRKITFLMGSTQVTSDYFQWVAADCQGLLPEQNRGQVRNEGLHFPAVPAYTAEYRIPVVSGDAVSVDNSMFTCTKSSDGKYWSVKMNTQTSPGITIANLTISNNGLDIHYKLYRTGWFHQLTSSMTSIQRDDRAVTGWFYYEVVTKGSQYFLDRNLGASTNAPYISTYHGYDGNNGAVGAYFKIATSKSSSTANPTTVRSQLNIGDFNIPTKDEVSAWGVTLSNENGTNNAAYKVATITVDAASQVTDRKVYLPHGGYFDGEADNYVNHANIWTRTLLSGNQGYSASSPEFGFWYMYFDAYESTTKFSNMRFCSGSNGQTPDAYSLYKYMPIRLKWK